MCGGPLLPSIAAIVVRWNTRVLQTRRHAVGIPSVLHPNLTFFAYETDIQHSVISGTLRPI